MKNLSRIEIGREILAMIYQQYHEKTDEELADIFYQFLISEKEDAFFITQQICFQYEITPNQLKIYKQDMMLDILHTGYGYLCYVRSFTELPSSETTLLGDLDQLPFSMATLKQYFQNPEKEELIKRLLIDYFIYTTQDSNFREGCEEYLFDEPREFGDKLGKYIRYIEASDYLASIYRETSEEYHEEEEYEDEEFLVLETDNFWEEEEEDEDDDEYEEEEETRQKKIEEEQKTLYQRVTNFLEEYFDGDKFEADDFIGFFMSIVYGLLLDARDKNILTLEDEEMLNLLHRPEYSFELVVESFWYSKEYVFDALDLFVDKYYDFPDTIFDTREHHKDNYSTSHYQLLDPFYTQPPVDYHVIYCGSPLFPKIQEILKGLEKKEHFEEEVYQLLRDPKAGFEGMKPYHIEEKDTKFYQLAIIRYLTRKYLEETSSKSVGSLNADELFIYQALLTIDCSNANMKKLFDMGYTYYLEAYQKLEKGGKSRERKLIRRLKSQNLLRRTMMIDQCCFGDPLYFKTLTETPFYRELDTKGMEWTIFSLQKKYQQNRKECYEILKEILVSAYYFAEKNPQDEFSKIFLKRMEEEPIDTFLEHMMKELPFLREVLKKYEKEEGETPYALSLEEKLELSPKIKQKLYPTEKRGNG